MTKNHVIIWLQHCSIKQYSFVIEIYKCTIQKNVEVQLIASHMLVYSWAQSLQLLSGHVHFD